MAHGCCYVIGAGDLTVCSLHPGEEDMVIAVDGGLSYCGVMEVEPDLIIGDFDSVNEQELQAVEILKQQIPDRVIQLSPQKDDTDMLAALKLGLERGYRDFRLYAATGGRLDHTIANLQCLLYLKNRDARGYICDGTGMIFVMKDEEVRFKKNMEGYLSLFAMNREAKGVTIQGMKYPLEQAVITNDFPVGISNEFIGEEALVRVEEGELLGIIQYN